MTTFEIIKKLANQHDKSLQQVAEDLNFSKNLFYRWKTSDPKAKDLAKVADYFGVTTDYRSLAYLNNGGTEIDEEDAELIKSALERTLRRSKLLAKEKFTPKKYRK